ncbi:SIMPL domain-containing protein [Marivirga salinae]|uniref:SIMPL domain-containing protein n=1 Tax=Marivirga salinarum TaxID=3059078 RepID=A0AA49JBS6_9BACT|nr:SIMPL domain-containing protein [Marivirga sp. BDSF4-3]WKK76474.2 SIMPL domain-containing protein [Marivirga sp. BDSF4-3]
MKKLSVFILAILIISILPQLKAQEKSDHKKLRTISVSGVAEKEVEPDIIYFTISLKEYQLKTGSKFQMSELENQLVNSVEKAGIDKENLTVENVYGYNYSWNKKTENKDFMARKQFQLKLPDAKKLNVILSQIDPKAIEYARVCQYTHSRLQELNQELQVEAVKNAKAKAEALLKPLDEKVGKVLEVSENQQNFQPIYYKSYQNNRMLSESADANASMESNLDFKNIKLKAEVHIVFLIQ